LGLKESVIRLVAGREMDELEAYRQSSQLDDLIVTRSFTLGKATSKVVIDSEAPLAQRITPEISRVSKPLLEAAYIRESTVFNGINKTVQVIMAAGYTLDGDKRSVKFFEDFFGGVGSSGGETEWDEMYSSLFKHLFVFGDAWIEKIPAIGDDGKIVDLELIDPKTMDLAKDSAGEYVLDVNMNPVGYVQNIPFKYTVEQKYAVPDRVDVSSNQLFFPPDRIAHFKLYCLGDRFNGVGLIEPAYNAINRKLVLEKAHANSTKRMGFPVRRAEVGDPMHEPTREQLQRAIEQIKDADNMGVFAHPYWVKVHIDEAKNPEKLQEHLDYYIDQIVAAIGMPRAFITGAGEETNRSTLNRQEFLFKLSLKEIVERTNRSIEKQIIKPIAEANGIKPVKIQWGEITVEELDAKAKRLATYASAKLLTPSEELETLVRSIENLPERVIRERR